MKFIRLLAPIVLLLPGLQAAAATFTFTGTTSASLEPSTTYEITFEVDNSLFSVATFAGGPDYLLARNNDGVETTLSVKIGGVETFNETSAGVRDVAVTADGEVFFTNIGGNLGGLLSFSSSRTPDFSFNIFTLLPEPTAGSHQLGGILTQFQFNSPTSTIITDAPTLPAVPLPASAWMLIAAITGAAGLRSRLSSQTI